MSKAQINQTNSKDYDVAIVGGGLLGSAFGYGLAMRGLNILVLDEGDHAIRTARGNFGLVWVQGKGLGMPQYAAWTLQSAMEWQGFSEQLRDHTGIDPRYQRPGGFEICIDDAELQSVHNESLTLRQQAVNHEYQFELLDHAALKKELPIVGNVAGANYCPNDGHCNPLTLLRALQAGLIGQGGRYQPHARVLEVTSLNHGGFRLKTDKAVYVDAEKVIIAAGHGSPELGRSLGLEIPSYPDQGQILVTEKAQATLEYPTLNVRQTDEGSFLLGPSSRDVGFDLNTEPGTLKNIAQRCVKIFPFLKNLRLQRSWAALRIMTPDGFPVYQQSEAFPGAFCFSCHSGVTLAAVQGNPMFSP